MCRDLMPDIQDVKASGLEVKVVEDPDWGIRKSYKILNFPSAYLIGGDKVESHLAEGYLEIMQLVELMKREGKVYAND